MSTFVVWLKEHKKKVVIIACVAVFVRLILFVVILHVHNNDLASWVGGAPATYQQLATHDINIAGDCYYETSANLLAGHGFSCELLPPYVQYQYGVPLYPLFIAAILFLTHSYYVALLIQILISVATCILGMYVADLYLSWAKAPTFVGIILALEPNQVLSPLNFASEVFFMPLFFTFLIMSALYFKTANPRYLLWAGSMLGLATLIKPTTQYLPVLFMLFVLWQQRHRLTKKLFLHFAAFLGVFVLMLVPWLYNNYRQFGVVQLSTQAVRNPYMALLPSVLSLQTGESFDEAQAKLFQIHPNNFTFANSVGMTRYTVSQLARYPVADLKVVLISVVTFFTADDIATLYNAVGIQPDLHLDRPALQTLASSPILAVKTIGAYIGSNVVLILLGRVFFIFLTFAFLYGLYAVYRAKRQDVVFNFAVLLVVYFMLTTVSNGFGVTARFRMPIEVFILAIAYAGIQLFFYAKRIS